jgi:hypothetical protein
MPIVLGPILTADRVPEPRHDDEEGDKDDREGRAAVARRLAREHGEERQDRHLDEDVRPGAAVFAPVELVVERPVRPRYPDDSKDDEELKVAADRH